MSAGRGLVLPALLFGGLAAAPFVGLDGAFALTLLARAMILGLAAVGLALLVGGGGLISLGQAAMFGAGAYVVAALDVAGVTEAGLVFPAAVAAGAVLAGVTGAVAVRIGGVPFIMITLAFGQMAYFTAASFSGLGGDDGTTLYARTLWRGGRALEDRVVFHFLCLVALVVAWALCGALLGSRFGRVLRAAKEDALRVEALGFSPYGYRLGAYVVAGGIAGLAGALMANATGFVSPATLSWGRSAELLFMVILGGATRLHGAVAGALAFVLLEEALSRWFGYWRLVFGPLLVLSVVLLPQGLVGIGAALRLRRTDG